MVPADYHQQTFPRLCHKAALCKVGTNMTFPLGCHGHLRLGAVSSKQLPFIKKEALHTDAS
jgi:hypothetical protein